MKIILFFLPIILSFNLLSGQTRQLLILDQGDQCILNIDLGVGVLDERLCDEGRLVTNAQSMCLVESKKDAYIYIGDRALTHRRDLTTNENEVVASVNLPDNFLTDIDYDGKELFWADYRRHTIFNARERDIETPETLFQDSTVNISSIAVSKKKNKVFWCDPDSSKIYSSRKNGQQVDVIVVKPGCISPSRLSVNDVDSRIYWTEDFTGRIMSADFNGGDIKVLYQEAPGSYPYGIYFDETTNELYWTNYGSGNVKRASVNEFPLVPAIVYSGLKTPLDLLIFDASIDKLSSHNPGLKTDVLNSVTIYPNPVASVLSISISTDYLPQSCHVRITSLEGRTLLSRQIPSGNTFQFSVDISGLVPGIYYALVDIDGVMTQRKFVKK